MCVHSYFPFFIFDTYSLSFGFVYSVQQRQNQNQWAIRWYWWLGRQWYQKSKRTGPHWFSSASVCFTSSSFSLALSPPLITTVSFYSLFFTSSSCLYLLRFTFRFHFCIFFNFILFFGFVNCMYVYIALGIKPYSSVEQVKEAYEKFSSKW